MSEIRQVPRLVKPPSPAEIQRHARMTLSRWAGYFIGGCLIACACVASVALLVWLMQSLVRMVR